MTLLGRSSISRVRAQRLCVGTVIGLESITIDFSRHYENHRRVVTAEILNHLDSTFENAPNFELIRFRNSLAMGLRIVLIRRRHVSIGATDEPIAVLTSGDEARSLPCHSLSLRACA
jgi:hypothetical protein